MWKNYVAVASNPCTVRERPSGLQEVEVCRCKKKSLYNKGQALRTAGG